MKIIFLGTPNFAKTVLEGILNSCHKVVAVVAQPDKVNARGGKTQFSPVKQFALEKELRIFQFDKISQKENCDILRSLTADIMVTSAYGQILSREVLDLTKGGVINVHGSLLPKYRGASPVQCAILNGETEIGITIMKTELSVDSGDMILKRSIILSDENACEAMEKLAVIGAEALVTALNLIEKGEAVFTPQNESEATFCKKISKEQAHLSFNQTAEKAVNFIRAMAYAPSAYIKTRHGNLKILKAKASTFEANGAPFGTVVRADKRGVLVMCLDFPIELLSVQGEGGKVMAGADYFRGRPVNEGERFNE
ncbi:MAG: methionyl-tRNA formyltransferase [Firmicutes bacterium]|nr:methionyl-tRNA formyltransferase [Bacillota bacterium]